MAQGAQLAEDLEKVKPSDFEDICHCCIHRNRRSVAASRWGEIIYFILQVHGIRMITPSYLSSETLGTSFVGHKSGDHIGVPDGQVVLKDVLPLSADVSMDSC